MSEITKLYENAEVEKFCNSNSEFCPVGSCDECNFNIYPPFTAEKQLELIKWLMNNPKDFFSWTIQQQGKDTKYVFYVGYEYGGSGFLEFTEALAEIINDLWQDLTSEEKQQIKEILK